MKNLKNILLGLLLIFAGSVVTAEGPDSDDGFAHRGEQERRHRMDQRMDAPDGDRQDFRDERRGGDDHKRARGDRRGQDGDRRDFRDERPGEDGDRNFEGRRDRKKKGSTEEGEKEGRRGQLRDPAEFHQVVNEYKAFVAKVSPETREEIITFRKEIARLNKEKGLLYKKLSSAAQEYLSKERQYKKKLPTNRKDLLKMDGAPEQKK